MWCASRRSPTRRAHFVCWQPGRADADRPILGMQVCREAAVRSERDRRSAISLLVRAPLARITISRCWVVRSARAPAAVGAPAVVTPRAGSSALARWVQGAAPRRRNVSSATSGEELGGQKVLLATEGSNRGDSGAGGAGHPQELR